VAEDDKRDGVTLRDHAVGMAEDSAYRAECQITAAGFWGNVQLFVGSAAAISAAVAGASAFSKKSVLAGVLAVAASALTASLTAVKAGDRASTYESSATEFNLLTVDARTFAESGSSVAGVSEADAYKQLVKRRDDLARNALFVNRRLCRKAVRLAREGQPYFDRKLQGSLETGPVRRVGKRIAGLFTSASGPTSEVQRPSDESQAGREDPGGPGPGRGRSRAPRG
jgi:hypothetical protein